MQFESTITCEKYFVTIIAEHFTIGVLDSITFHSMRVWGKLNFSHCQFLIAWLKFSTNRVSNYYYDLIYFSPFLSCKLDADVITSCERSLLLLFSCFDLGEFTLNFVSELFVSYLNFYQMFILCFYALLIKINLSIAF